VAIRELDRLSIHQRSSFRSLDVVISECASQNRIVAQCHLPFTFQFVPDFPVQCARPPPARVKRSRREMEEELDEGPSDVDQRNVRPRLDEPSQRGIDGERADHPMPAVNPRGTTQGSQSRDNSPPGPPSPSIPLPQPLQAVPAPTVDEPFNLDPNEGVTGCVPHSTLV